MPPVWQSCDTKRGSWALCILRSLLFSGDRRLKHSGQPDAHLRTGHNCLKLTANLGGGGKRASARPPVAGPSRSRSARVRAAAGRSPAATAAPCAIAGVGGHALAQGRGQQQRVAIEPDGSALGLRQRKAPRNEVMRGQVEFAENHRVGTAARQHQNSAVVHAGDRRGPAPRPVFSLPRPPPRRCRAGCPTPASHRGSCRASLPATGRADARRPSRN